MNKRRKGIAAGGGSLLTRCGGQGDAPAAPGRADMSVCRRGLLREKAAGRPLPVVPERPDSQIHAL